LLKSARLNGKIAKVNIAMSDSVVLIDKLNTHDDKYIAVVTLNSQGTLNALSQAMVDILLPQMRAWNDDPALVCVVLRGAGDKAFCAGGDILNLYKSITSGDGSDADRFFEEEYRLDYLIHTFNKPIVAWGNGIVMGGGLGLMAGSSHRVVTERTRLAMPEVGIGLYPDVGGSYFLNRSPGRSGLFIGLTGVSCNASDSIYIGVADSYANHSQWPELLAALTAAVWSDDAHGTVSAILADLASRAVDQPPSSVQQHAELIDALTNADNVMQMITDITSYEGDDVWMQKAVKSLQKACPSSVFVFYEQLKRSRALTLKEVFQNELVLSLNFMRIGNFAEGVRALLIDKDLSPCFAPATFEKVDQAHIEKHFSPPWSGENPLNNL